MIEIKEAVLEDSAEITVIKTRAFNKEINRYLGRNGGPPGYDKIESEEYIIKNFIAKKILLNGELIGAFFLIDIGDNKMRFEDFVIEPCYQGQGYGQYTLKLIEEMYPKVNEWQLSTPIFSVGNQHLYEKFGFVERTRNDDEIEYYKMVL